MTSPGPLPKVLPERHRWALVSIAVVGSMATAVLGVAASHNRLPVGMTVSPGVVGLLVPGVSSSTMAVSGVVLSIAVLVTCWWRLLRLAPRLADRQVLGVAGVWALPLIICPPLLSWDAYAYLAQGRMLAESISPYQGGPILLGSGAALAQVDPLWRTTPSPYGPLTLVLFRGVAMVSRDLTVELCLLRLLSVLGVVVAVAAAGRLASPRHKTLVYALTAANPLVLIDLIGGMHIDAVLAAVVGLVVLALRRDRMWSAWGLAAVAVAVKITAVPLMLFVGLDLVRRRRRRLGRGRIIGLVVPAAVIASLAFVVPWPAIGSPLGFLAALGAPGRSPSWYAPAALTGDLLAQGGALVGWDLLVRHAPVIGQAALTLAGGTALVALLWAHYRDGARGGSDRAGLRIGLSLVAVALCLPALYGWYPAAGLFLVAALGSGRVQLALVALSSALSFSSIPVSARASRPLLVLTWLVVVALLAREVRRCGAGRWVPAGVSIRRWALRHGQCRVGRDVAGKVTDGPRPVRLRRLPMLELAVAGIGLMLTVGVILPASPAEADSQRRAVQIEGIVAQLAVQYPALEPVTVVPQSVTGHYRVTLAYRGRLCRLLLLRRGDRRVHYVRTPPPPGLTRAAIDHLDCPAPATERATARSAAG